jgi:hypothetical protein
MTCIWRTPQVTLLIGALVATVVSGCGSSATPSAPQGVGSESVTTSSSGPLNAAPVTSAVPAFADNSGGILAPAGDTKFPLTAGAVQALLAKDGASAPWVAESPRLVVQSGLYYGLTAATPGSQPSTSTEGIPTYVFSQDMGPCPPSSGGGAGTPAPGSTQPTTCTGTVVANAVTGDIIDVEIRPE